MKVCSKCGNNCPDGASFCNVCGSPLGAEAAQDSTNTQDAAQNAYQAPQQAYAYVDPSDHTAEFDAADISENKVLAMLPYLLSWIGVIVALLGSHDSKFAAFHVKQALKLTVVNTLLVLCAGILCWTVIVPIAAGVCMLIVYVVRIICFFNVCSGKAKEPPIVKSLGFLK